ncbi:MAG TPA: aromatic ring-hydroxylating dioxygenase subunit alpha [Rhizomicrobium sp.]|nr:aromatic ring-hydroxylating dioxygenase subunit alpha [Rhizomicrobium sp.]
MTFQRALGERIDLRRTGAHPDHWYPLAWSHEIGRGKALARNFAGLPIVLYRGRSGSIHALEDRCAHRQVPLSEGMVEGETLRCGYHGWRYDRAGACVDVPYLGGCHVPNGVRAYPAREIDGMVFVFPGDAALAEARAPARLGAKSDPAYKTRRLDRSIACHYTFMHENLFDMNHQFLHRSLMGGVKATCLDRRTGPDWCEVDYTFTRRCGRANMGENAIRSMMGRKGAGGDLMTIRTAYPYQTLKVWVKGEEPALDVWLCYTPQDKAQRTNRTFGYLSVKKAPVPGLTQLLWPFIILFTDGIFRQDKRIVELEQAAHDAQGCCHNHEVFPPVLDLRAVLGRCGVPLNAAPVALPLCNQ